MLLPRIITAFFFGMAVVLGIFYLPPLFFLAVISIIIVIAAGEMARFFWPKNKNLRIFFLGLLMIFYAASQMLPFLPTLILGGIWWLCVPYLLVRYTKNGIFINPPNKIATFFDFSKYLLTCFIGILTFVPAANAMITLQFDYGPKYLLSFLLIVWSADIGAYFAGKAFGNNLIAEKISPKKTFEGLIGGILIALSVAIFMGLVLQLRLNAWVLWLFFILIVVLWSLIGDLFESMLKRASHVKDSGKILPGHGGMYDRIDSLTSAAPLFVLGLMLMRL